MEMEPLVLEQPAVDQGRLVGGVVFEYQVDVEVSRHLAVDAVEEAAELGGAVTPMHRADHLAVGDIDGGEERRRATPPVVVGA